jgi:hypothetical protein
VCTEPVAAGFYGTSYFDNYASLAQTEMGHALTAARLALVRKHLTAEDTLVDVGSGAGAFIEQRPTTLTYGIDICPKAVEWLSRNGREWPCRGLPNASFWDSLEHVVDLPAMVNRVEGHAFVSMPIYDDQRHALRSRHYKPGEHVWYFTEPGLVRMFDRLGFDLEERVFRRRDP